MQTSLFLKNSAEVAYSVLKDRFHEIVFQEDQIETISRDDLFKRFVEMFDDESDGDMVLGEMLVLDDLGVFEDAGGGWTYWVGYHARRHGKGSREDTHWDKLRADFDRMLGILSGDVLCFADGHSFCDPKEAEFWAKVR